MREAMFGQPTADSLLEHVGFLRGLARSLVFDDGQAEDVVQEALIVALNNEPRHPSRMRAWLAGITRNLALKRLRTQGRRTKRERAVARPEALASTADVVSRLDLQRRVVEEVMNLAEPYRSTLVYRYFDDLTTREIAQRMAIPIKTVETRLRRGVAQLRLKMDVAHGGDRKLWVFGLAALVPAILTKEVTAAVTAAAVAGKTAGAGALTGVAMSTKATVVGVAGLVATSFLVGRSVTEQEAAKTTPHVATRPLPDPALHEMHGLLDALESERAHRRSLEQQLAVAGENTWTPWGQVPTKPSGLRIAVGPAFSV